jgi:hypothetical protein
MTRNSPLCLVVAYAMLIFNLLGEWSNPDDLFDFCHGRVHFTFGRLNPAQVNFSAAVPGFLYYG